MLRRLHRHFLALLCVLALSAADACARQPADSQAAAQQAARPNILWFVVDDMSANFSCYGEQLIETPHVDRLAREGTRFTHAFVSAPVCSTCRSALITGMYQTAIGAEHHRSGRGTLKIRLPEGVEPIPALLQRAGYYTCIGTGLVPANQPASSRQALGKTDYNFEWDPSIYDSADWAGRQEGQPFFMQVQLPGGKLRGENKQQRKKFVERIKREFGDATSPDKVVLPPYYPRDPELLEDWAAYLDSVRATDRQVGEVLARLEREGLLDQTLIIFMTDHGISHARGKQFLYDEGTQIPLVVRGPGIAAGAVRDDLVVHLDLAAVTLAAAGIELPAKMQARDFLGDDYQPHTAIFAARDRCDETVDRIRSVRTGEFLYIRNDFPLRPLLQPNAYKDNKAILIRLRELQAAGRLDELTQRLLFSPTRPVEELYRWQADRWQLKNLAEDETFAATLSELRGALNAWQAANGDTELESPAMYDSDMRVYVGGGKPEVEANIDLMKRWASEGR